MKRLLLFIFCFSTVALFPQSKINAGMWRGVLTLNKEQNIELPFIFEIVAKNKDQIVIHNATERIVVDEVTIKGDSLNFKMPVFDSEFRTKLINGALEGVWINHSRKDKNILAFKAEYNKTSRFNFPADKPHSFYEGKWECDFSSGTSDSSKAIGIFKHENGSVYVTGTFLTETGDYRYLDGMMSKGKLYLSCFDGSHAFLFTAESSDGNSITKGDFYSGMHHHESWTAKRNDKFELRNPESLTYLKNPNEKINFSFPNLENKTVTLNDKKFENKPVIIQIMGSWCPNCMDETAYLSEVYKKNKAQGLEIIALAYERSPDFEKAKTTVSRVKNRFGVEYEILITGVSGAAKASETLPFLNKVMAFPTTIILDKKHLVRSIYTGFNGPATGKAYDDYKHQTEILINKLIKE